MPAVLPDDVAAGLLTRWAAVSALNTLVPAANVAWGRNWERVGMPKARLLVQEATRNLTSGPTYWQEFTATVECHTASEPPVSATLRAAIEAAFEGTSADPSAGLVVANGTVLHSQQVDPGDAGRPQTFERIDAKDVLRIVARFRITVSGSRG